MKMRGIRYVGMLMLALFAGACASSGGGTGQTLDVTVQVDNNLPNLTGLTVFMVTETGSRRSLGPVNSNQRQMFERQMRAGTYQLLASRVGGEDIASERFRLDSSPVTVFWNVHANQVTFSR